MIMSLAEADVVAGKHSLGDANNGHLDSLHATGWKGVHVAQVTQHANTSLRSMG